MQSLGKNGAKEVRDWSYVYYDDVDVDDKRGDDDELFVHLQIGSVLESKDSDAAVRSAALDLAYALYAQVGQDLNRLLDMLAPSAADALSAKASSMVEDRIKQRNKEIAATAGASAAASSSSSSLAVPINAASTVSSSSPAPMPSTSVNAVRTPPRGGDEAADEPFGRLEQTPMTTAKAAGMGNGMGRVNTTRGTRAMPSALPESSPVRINWGDDDADAEISSSSSNSTSINITSPRKLSATPPPHHHHDAVSDGSAGDFGSLESIYSEIIAKVI